MHAFRVIPHATRLGRADLTKTRPSDALFGKRTAGDRVHFLQLRSGQAESEPSVYHIVKYPDRRAHVKYHDLRHLDASRGKILYDFVQSFLEYLRELEITGHTKQRTLTQFKVKSPETLALDFSNLGSVGVYDNRFARDTYPLVSYVDLLARMRPDVIFAPVEQLTDLPAGARLLVLLDAGAADFAVDGILAGRQDPYQEFYSSTPGIPKQSLVVNFNDPNALDGRDYLDYPFPTPSHRLELNLEASVNELYLKCAIVRGFGYLPLPLAPTDRAFVCKDRHDGETYTTALWFGAGRLHFADLGDPTAREESLALAGGWGVDYMARLEEYFEHLLRQNDLPSYELVLGPDLFVAIEDLEERVLYDSTPLA
ncbi:MAG: hypothetical protein ACLQUY_10775 [Ktedonobacterales bacterium]